MQEEKNIPFGQKVARYGKDALAGVLKGGEEKAKQVVNGLKIFTQATSLGGVESLIEHRYSVEGPDSKTPKNLLRVSVGLETVKDVIADLEQALE